MSWIPLPFPKCPKCHNSWSLSYHKDCPHNSDVEVETILKRSRCSPCNLEWSTLDGQFHCSCGHVFIGREVESAILKTLELKEKLAHYLKEMDFDERRIEVIAKDSIKSWLNKTSFELGKKLGIIAGTIIRIITSIFR